MIATSFAVAGDVGQGEELERPSRKSARNAARQSCILKICAKEFVEDYHLAHAEGWRGV